MNDAKKIRELQEIFFEESKDNEMNKSNLQNLSKKHDKLEMLCKELVESFDCRNDISSSINKIKDFLKEN